MHRCQSHSQCVASIGIHTIKVEVNLPCGSLESAIIFLPAKENNWDSNHRGRETGHLLRHLSYKNKCRAWNTASN